MSPPSRATSAAPWGRLRAPWEWLCRSGAVLGLPYTAITEERSGSSNLLINLD